MPPPAENADSASDPPLLTCEEAIVVAKVGGLMAESWTILALWEERTDAVSHSSVSYAAYGKCGRRSGTICRGGGEEGLTKINNVVSSHSGNP